MDTSRTDASAEAGGIAGRAGEEPEYLRPAPALLRAIVHELSQPLTACRGALELALLKAKSSGEFRKGCEKAFAAAERMVTILQTVQELAEVSALPGRSVPVELTTLARHVVGELAPLAEARGVIVSLENAPKTIAQTDEERLSHALLKVLHLAILRSPKHGRVQVSFAARAEGAWLSIQDEGRPLAGARPPERASGGGSDAEGVAADLDLAVARQAIESLGGSLSAENLQARGSRFSIRIPRARETNT